MPRRKKLPPIPDYTDGGKNPETHLIQKSNPLLSLSETDMTLPELKILDVYLDRIDSHNEEKRTVQFEKGEIEEMLGVSRILKNDLEKRLRHLAQVVKVEDETKPKGFKLISLFEEIDAWQDEDGLWQISLTCTNRAREYIFNIDNIGYLRYRLKSVISLTSRYSYVLYLWLEHNRFRRSWEIDLAELKALLRCTADTYKEFKRFNDLVLKKCQKEISEKTDCRFTYEPVKRGRVVRAVRFTVETLSEIEDIPGQMNLDEFGLYGATLTPEQERRDEICRGFSDSVFNGFSDEQLEVLKELAYKLPDIPSLAKRHEGNVGLVEAMQYAVSEALTVKIKTAKIRKPKNLFLYVKKMLENEIKGDGT